MSTTFSEKTGYLNWRFSMLKPAHWLLIILGFALILRLTFFMGLCVADDFTYSRFANMILHGDRYFSSENEFRSLRWPTILPVVLSFRLFGVSDGAAVWGSLVYSLAGIVVLFWVGRHLFGDRVGLYAALLLAVFPCDVVFATQLMPDIVIPFFMGLSVLFFIKGDSAKDSREAMWYYGACGLAMLGAFLCRVTAVYHFFFFACFAFSRRRWKRGAWLAIGAFGIALGLLYIFYFIKSGDLVYELTLLHKIRATEERMGRITQLNLTRNLQYMLPAINSQVGRFDTYAIEVRIWLASTYLFGFFYYFIIPCFFYWGFQAWKRKAENLAVPVLWLLVTYLYSEFGPISIDKYQTMVKLPRYLSVQTFPGLLLVALSVDRLIHQRREGGRTAARVACGIGSLLFLGATSVVICQHEAVGLLEPIALYRATYALLKDRPRKEVFVVGGWWPLRMSHYLGRENGYIDPPDGPGNRLRLLKGLRDVRDIRDAYVILDRNPFMGVGDFKFSYSEFPLFVERTPSHWKKLSTVHNNIDIYYAPGEVPAPVVDAYAKPRSSDVDFSTWEGAKSALERSIRENDYNLFKRCLSEKFKAMNDNQVRAMFDVFMRNPNAVLQLERKHFFEENGKWRPMMEVQQAKGEGPSVVVQ